jgi:hypothetical protein
MFGYDMNFKSLFSLKVLHYVIVYGTPMMLGIHMLLPTPINAIYANNVVTLYEFVKILVSIATATMGICIFAASIIGIKLIDDFNKIGIDVCSPEFTDYLDNNHAQKKGLEDLKRSNDKLAKWFTTDKFTYIKRGVEFVNFSLLIYSGYLLAPLLLLIYYALVFSIERYFNSDVYVEIRKYIDSIFDNEVDVIFEIIEEN